MEKHLRRIALTATASRRRTYSSVAAAPIGDQSTVVRADYADSSGLKVTGYSVIFTKDNVTTEVDMASSSGQNSADDASTLANRILARLTGT